MQERIKLLLVGAGFIGSEHIESFQKYKSGDYISISVSSEVHFLCQRHITHGKGD